MGPGHPGWSEIGDRESREGPFVGPGPERLPPGSIPPGARFDPIVPEQPRRGFRPSSRIIRPRPPMR